MSTLEASPLVVNTGLWEKGLAESPFADPLGGRGCLRVRHGMWLVSTHGERVRMRCRATNLCDYCAKLVAIENAEMLALDACRGNAPQVWCVLTTRAATLDMDPFYAARKEVMRRVRHRWEGAEYASLLEFTTGYGPNAAGERRPHWNKLIKGVAVADVDELRYMVVAAWCAHVDAEPVAQHVGPVSDLGGLMAYVALHFQKESQAPPDGFRGQRFNCSRAYFDGMTRAEARDEARDSLQQKRLRYEASQHGLSGDDAEDWIDHKYAVEGLPDFGIYYDPPPRAHPPRASGERVHA